MLGSGDDGRWLAVRRPQRERVAIYAGGNSLVKKKAVVKMPPFKGVLSEEEVSNVAAYMVESIVGGR